MTLKERFMNLFNKYNIAQVTGITTALSSEMAEKIELWGDMVQHNAPWNDEAPGSGVIEAIAGELSNPVAEELDVSAPNNEVLNKVLQRLNESSTELVQNLALCGASLIRPIYSEQKKELQFEIIRLGNYIPLSYDFDGQITGAVILKKFDDSNKHYLLLEKHNYTNRTHTTVMELYEILGESGTLKKVQLSACPQTANLTPSYTWHEVEMPMIVEIRNRKPNKVDGSNVPCAIYAGNENLIEDADRQYNRMNWEQESAERKVFADEDLFTKRQTKDSSGNTRVSFGSRFKRIFVKVNSNGVGEEKITTFNPELRTEGQVTQFNQILRRIELACNIGKGTLSDLETVQQTATQYTGGKKTLYTMIDSIESELEEKYHYCAYVFATMENYFMKLPFNDEIEITFNDTSRKDPVQMKQEALQELNAGVMNKWEYRMQFFGEDEDTAKLNTPETETGGFVL